jgi:hypothetical protein
MIQAGQQILDHQIGDQFFIDQETWKNNYVYIPPISVDFDSPFLNSISSMQPSPDWITGFYMFDTIDQYDRTFWDRFTIRTYPWDAGTDSGQYYTAPDSDVDPPDNVARIKAANAPASGAFLSPDGGDPLPVAEWDCVLHACPVYDPDCQKADFPPQNYCDILKYPECYSYCNPEEADEELPCNPCKGNGWETKLVWFHDCCVSGHEPRSGPSCTEMEFAASGAGMWTTTLALVAVCVSTLLLG